MLKNDIVIALRNRIEEYETLFEKYDKEKNKLNDIQKSEQIEELVIKVELLITHLQKTLRYFNDMLDDGNYNTMIRSDIEKSIKEIKENLKYYSSNSYGFTEILRGLRLRISNQFQLDKNSIV